MVALWSITNRTARCRTSSEKPFDVSFVMAPSSQQLRSPTNPGRFSFHVLPKRWVVERTFSWMMRWRRLVRDYERRCDVSEAMIRVSLGAVLLRRAQPFF